MIFLLLVFTLVLFILWYQRWSQHWEKRGVPGPKPLPIMGNLAKHLLARKTMGQAIREIYNKYDNYPFVGIFRASTPCLLIRDPDMANKIMVRDHKAFYNNEFFVDKKIDPLLGQNPFVLRNEEWKETRQMLSPGFAVGRIKNLYQILYDISDKFTSFIENHPNAATGIETRELTKRFTLENVAKSAFGIDGKSFENYDRMSEFMILANTVVNPGSLKGILIHILLMVPFLSKLLPLQFCSKEVENAFVDIISNVMEHRKKHNEQNNDYLHFILQLAEKKDLSKIEIAGHCATFFLDGYETSSQIMTFLFLNLAQHPQYQQKIREEIKRIEGNIEGGVTYDNLCEMKWLDACILETLRITPIVDVFPKVCTQPYEYTSENPEFKKLSVKLNPNDIVLLPYSFLMNDEKYFKNPSQFMPERWMDAEGITKNAFFPFGSGPRQCIGQKFGMMQLKLGTMQVLKQFKISVSPKMTLPIKLIPLHFLNEVKGGVWLRYTKK